jgi:peptidoglycan/LPS O-acetylase OafA/YrhL
MYRLLPMTTVSALPLAFLSGVSGRELADNMLLLSHSMNGVLWSLQAEMVASGVLFLLWGLSRGSPWRMAVGFVVTVAVLPFNRGNSLVMFLPAFVLGAGISLVPARVWRSTALLVPGIVVLVFTNVVLGHGQADRCFEMAGAVVLVGAVSQGRLPFLGRPVPLFLGAISYPFYLTHVLGLAAAQPVLDLLHFASPYPMIAARAVLSIPPVILLAWALHVWIEAPVQRAAPRLAWPAFRLRRGGVAAIPQAGGRRAHGDQRRAQSPDRAAAGR